ncbi:hypothetical protein CCOS2040_01520 [Streptomyces albidoflavus]|nr:hypothetical protein CCOS2040_01520 [Streptomyces albidoflavus]
MVALVCGGTLPGVARETRTMVRKPTGTDQTAGQASRVCSQPERTTPATVRPTASSEAPPPSRSPATAPGGVSRRHQMPRTSRGQKAEAETAKAMPTASATGTPLTRIVPPNGTAMARTVANRKWRTPREGSTSWLSTPATAMVRPEAVERKAAKAPPATRAPRRSPPTPPTMSPGRSSTVASASWAWLRAGA